MIVSRNPFTGEVVQQFEPDSADAVSSKIEAAWSAYQRHRRTAMPERAAKMIRAAEILESEKDRFGRLMTLEMGKPIQAARDEAVKCASGCRFYAEHAAEFLRDERVEIDGGKAFVRYQPVGPVLAIMPWNFPFWQVFRFAAPALMAGNAGLLKHASNVPQCALAIQDILERAGFEPGVFQTLLIGSDAVDEVIQDARVRAVTLTGSVGAGSHVAASAGRHIKKTVLELGGSDPFIVMPSADLDAAVKTAVKARTINNGQSCIAAKRFIVAEEIAGEFERGFVQGMRGLKMGDPFDETTDIGPLAMADAVDALHAQVEASIAAGAKLLTGGTPQKPFYPPTVLSDIPRAAPAYREELFGPVASVFHVSGASEAIRLANDSEFGLGASVWTNDPAERDRFIEEIESGLVFVNGMVASQPKLPFGGVKKSGYGRELSGAGIREFVNIKTVAVTEAKPKTTE